MLEAKETTWIIDRTTGALTVEGLTGAELTEIAADVLSQAVSVNCARPVNIPPIVSRSANARTDDEECLRVFRIYHGSVVDGPGRRSVVQTSGCPLRCAGCFVPETHRIEAGAKLSISETMRLILDPAGEPRDGVTVLGGEPFIQSDGLAALLRELKRGGTHVTLYSGYTLEELRARSEASVHESLALADILIDGQFVAAESRNAGEWRGSRNQRIIHSPSTFKLS